MLGAEVFQVPFWAAYVLATIGFEAWLIGRWIGFGWAKSLCISSGLNVTTAVLVPVFLHPKLHQYFSASTVDRNPFLNALVVLLIFALTAAMVESLAWRRFAEKSPKQGKSILRTLWVHFLSIPLALTILLAPENPYQGTERTTAIARNRELQKLLKGYFGRQSGDAYFPAGQNARVILGQIAKELGADNAERLLLEAKFTRFGKQAPGSEYEWNHSLRGRKRNAVKKGERVWLLRRRTATYCQGFMLNHGHSVSRTTSCKILGYE